MNVGKEKTKVILMLLLVVLICTAVLMLAIDKRDMDKEKSALSTILEGTNWPLNEVPLIYKENMQVKNDTYTCEIAMQSGVSYNELREYLIELYKSGFEPNKEFGCQNPNYMTTTTENMELKEVLWIGKKDKYQITVTWAEEGAMNVLGDPYTFNFEIVLYTEPDSTTTQKENNNKLEVVNSGETLGSGEIKNSGETINSGEIINGGAAVENEASSGEVIDDVGSTTSGEVL